MQPYPNPNYFNQYPQYQNNMVMPSISTPPTPPAPQIARIVSDFNSITVGDIPTNGVPGFFIKSDYSEIQSRRWTDDGRITANTYRLATEPAADQVDPFNAIMERLNAIEEKLTAKPSTRKKEVVDE